MKFAKAKTKSSVSEVDIAKRIQESKAIFESYFDAMGSGGTPMTCSVKMASAGFHPDIVQLEVSQHKESISFKYDNGAYGYRDTTHVLFGNDMEYRLACSSNGEVRIYAMNEGGDATPFGMYDGVHQIMDPMFAFAYMGNVYIVFNVPTDEAIVKGSRGRIPKVLDEKRVSFALGKVAIIRFDGNGSDILNPSLGADSGYYASLVGDTSGFPLLLCANMNRDAYVSKLPVSFSDLVNGLFESDNEDDMVLTSVFPLGISVKRFSDNAAWHQIPLTGDPDYGISAVEFAESSESADKLKVLLPSP